MKTMLITLLRYLLAYFDDAPRKSPEYVASLPDQTYGPGVLETNSSTWLYVLSWASSQIADAREKNDNVNRDAVQTAVLRGEIKAMKSLMALSDPKRAREQE